MDDPEVMTRHHLLTSLLASPVAAALPASPVTEKVDWIWTNHFFPPTNHVNWFAILQQVNFVTANHGLPSLPK